MKAVLLACLLLINLMYTSISHANNNLNCIDSVKHHLTNGERLKKRQEYELAKKNLRLAQRKVYSCLPDSSSYLAESFYQLAGIYDATYNPDSALFCYEKALDIRLKIFSSNSKPITDIYKGMGYVYRYLLYDYQKAEEYFLKEYSNMTGSDEYSLYEKIVSYYNLGTTYRIKKDYDRAEIYIDQVLSETKASRDYKFLSLRSSALIVKANIRNSANRFTEALPYYLEGIKTLQELEGDNWYLLANYYNNLASNYYNLDNFDSSSHYYEKAISINNSTNNNNALSNNYFGLGELNLKFNHFHEAYQYFMKCLNIRQSQYGTQHLQVALTYRQLGLLYEKKQICDSALFYFQEGLLHSGLQFSDSSIFSNPSFDQLKKTSDLFMLVADKGSALYKLYLEDNDLEKLTASFRCYELAIALLHYNRKQFEEEGSQLYSLDHYHYVFQGALRSLEQLWSINNDHEIAERALNVMEQSKSVILLESLNKFQISKKLQMPDSLTKLDTYLKTKLSNLRGKKQSSSAQIEEILKKQYLLKEHYKKKFPSYFIFKYQDKQSLDLDKLQEYLQPDQAFIEYFRADSLWYLIGLTSDRIFFSKISHDDSLQNIYNTFRNSVSNPPKFTNQKSQFTLFVSSATGLYNRILKPVYENLNMPENIVFVLDAEFATVPLEALLASDKNKESEDYGQLDYLINHTVSNNAYSIKNYLYSDTINSDFKKVLAVAYGAKNVSELSGTKQEIVAIQHHFKGSFYYGNELNKNQLLQIAPQYNILHLAVHGNVDKENGEQAYLQLHSPQSDDGKLIESDIYNLRLHAGLVVLSACESGLGTWQRGEGIYSLSRAFSYAGAHSQIITLWKINDQSISQIMNDFYAGIKREEDVVTSLHRAKSTYIRDHEAVAAHPYFWAALSSINNYHLQKNNYFIIFDILILVIMAIAFFKISYFLKINRHRNTFSKHRN